MRLSLDHSMRMTQQQKMILAPRMIQSMEILQLPILALQERIEQEMGENPVLELQEDDPDLPAETTEAEGQDSPDAPSEEERELVINETTSNEADLYKKPGGIGLPCDPRGGMLFQTGEGDLQKFLDSAKENVEHYGKHGLRAFYASYHGVVVTEDGKPTCFTSWDKYNALLDKHDTAKVPQ